jgi:hypothetical protein
MREERANLTGAAGNNDFHDACVLGRYRRMPDSGN